jgi:hypothetical protein
MAQQQPLQQEQSLISKDLSFEIDNYSTPFSSTDVSVEQQ